MNTEPHYACVRDPRIRWADGLNFGADGYVYVTDSAIPDQMLRSKSHVREAGPSFIFRFRLPKSLETAP